MYLLATEDGLPRIMHETFYCTPLCRYDKPDGGWARRSVGHILFQVCLLPSQLRTPVSLGVLAVSSRTLVKHMG